MAGDKLFSACVNMKAPFIHGYLPSIIGLSEVVYISAYPGRVVLRWGIIQKKEKEIPLSNIVRYKIKKVNLPLLGFEYIQRLSFRDNNAVTVLDIAPVSGKNSGEATGITYLVKYLRKKIPKKEENVSKC